mmetsp:Transcript_1956/g.5443  ORF Transcript_1956/g.5443 Transcript_1956/m.5443 type:complete len:263 (+) Transcript_1956:224-1012(+)
MLPTRGTRAGRSASESSLLRGLSESAGLATSELQCAGVVMPGGVESSTGWGQPANVGGLSRQLENQAPPREQPGTEAEQNKEKAFLGKDNRPPRASSGSAAESSTPPSKERLTWESGQGSLNSSKGSSTTPSASCSQAKEAASAGFVPRAWMGPSSKSSDNSDAAEYSPSCEIRIRPISTDARQDGMPAPLECLLPEVRKANASDSRRLASIAARTSRKAPAREHNELFATAASASKSSKVSTRAPTRRPLATVRDSRGARR